METPSDSNALSKEPVKTVAKTPGAPSSQSGGENPASGQPNAPPKPVPSLGTGKSATASVVKKPKQDRPPEDDQGIWRISRRNFFSVAGWAAFFVFLGVSTIG